MRGREIALFNPRRALKLPADVSPPTYPRRRITAEDPAATTDQMLRNDPTTRANAASEGSDRVGGAGPAGYRRTERARRRTCRRTGGPPIQ